MSLLSFMKSKDLPPSHQRCHHHYDNGSRCRLPIDSASEHFCGRHINTGQLSQSAVEREAANLALYREVMGGARYLNSATAVNHVLDNLFRLTITGRIPQRIASKLTTQLRASLTSIRMKREEYKPSLDEIESLLEDIDNHHESLESQQNESEAEPEELDENSAAAADPKEPAVGAQLAVPAVPRPKTAPTNSATPLNANRAHVAPHSSAASFDLTQNESSANASSAEPFRNKDRGASQPRQIEFLKQEANRADRDPFFDFLPRPNSASDQQDAPAPEFNAAPASEAPNWDLPEFRDLRAAETRRRVADLVKGVWIGPKPEEINWDQLEQQIEYADKTNPTPLFRRRSNRWWTL